MRGYDARQEDSFFELFGDYYSLERSSGNKYSSEEYSLDRMLPLARIAGYPEQRLRIVHVAGTKGKGSTSFYFAALLRSAGLSCGVFSSPHLLTVRERFQVNGEFIGYEKLLKYSRYFVGELAKIDFCPSLFEIMVVLSMYIFVEEGCEYAVLETGVGGLLDATNYVKNPLCSVITPISFDHMHILGENIVDIAGQKAGIIKGKIPVVCGKQPYVEAFELVQRVATDAKSPFVMVEDCRDFACWGMEGVAPFLQDNFSLALTVCVVLGIGVDCGRFCLPVLRGRCEVLRREPLWLIDAAHNADSIEKLRSAVEVMFVDDRFTVVVGCVKGKDYRGVLLGLQGMAQRLILTNPLGYKGSELEGMVDYARELGLGYEVLPRIDLGCFAPDENVLFTGSFFTALIGEQLFMKLL